MPSSAGANEIAEAVDSSVVTATDERSQCDVGEEEGTWWWWMVIVVWWQWWNYHYNTPLLLIVVYHIEIIIIEHKRMDGNTS